MAQVLGFLPSLWKIVIVLPSGYLKRVLVNGRSPSPDLITHYYVNKSIKQISK